MIEPAETEVIGRYTVDRLLARGGMAEVFLARAQGPAGFAKQVVVKRILPEYAEDPLFVRMFLNEAHLAAMLNHPNIVHVFDFGEDQGRFFLAMEYVDGVSCRQLIRHHTRRQQVLPSALAVKLTTGFCEGLHFAHEYRDESGSPLNIVHRDISPDNLLVTTAGVPKIVDFGIAKAATSSDRTTTGVLKGKHNYMPPELIRGEPADRQLDVYALGICLYEMVVGRRPFRADTELQLIQMLLHQDAPRADELNPSVPKELSDILHRAIRPAKQERYPDCRAFQSALEDHLASQSLRVTSSDVGALVQAAALERASNERKTPTGKRSRPSFSRPEPLPAVEVDLETVAPTSPSRVSHRRSMLMGAAASIVTLAVIGAGWQLTRRGRREAPTAPANREELPGEARSGGKPTASTGAAANSPAPGVAAPTQVPLSADPRASQGSAGGVQPPSAPSQPGRKTESPSRATRTHEPSTGSRRKGAAAVSESATGEGFLTVRSSPWSEVYLDGQKVGTTPLIRLPVAAGSHKLELRNGEGTDSRKLSVAIQPGAEAKQAVIFDQ